MLTGQWSSPKFFLPAETPKSGLYAKSPQWSPLKNETYEKALYFYSI